MRRFKQLSACSQVRRLRRLAASVLPVYGFGGGRLTLINHEFNTPFRVYLLTPAAGEPPYVPGHSILRMHQRDHHDPWFKASYIHVFVWFRARSMVVNAPAC